MVYEVADISLMVRGPPPPMLSRMSCRSSSRSVILDCGSCGIRACANSPDDILDAGRFGILACAKVPLLILEAGRLGMSEAVRVSFIQKPCSAAYRRI